MLANYVELCLLIVRVRERCEHQSSEIKAPVRDRSKVRKERHINKDVRRAIVKYKRDEGRLQIVNLYTESRINFSELRESVSSCELSFKCY